MILEARGGVEPRAFPPSSCRFGLEDRRRERGPDLGGDGEIRTHTLLFTGQLLCQLELHRLRNCGRGVRPTRLCQLHAPRQSPLDGRGSSGSEKVNLETGSPLFLLFLSAQIRVYLRLDCWWSELESNQPFELFRPALIHLSYPTEEMVHH